MEPTEIIKIVEKQRAFFSSDITKSVEYRLEALKKLKKAIVENVNAISAALKSDLGKSEFESYESEIGIVLEELGNHIKNLYKWSRPERKATPLTIFPSVSRIYSEPFGVALIISPWNYPFQLLINPLVGAISAGNCAVLKTSPYAPAFAELIDNIISEIFPPEYVTVVHGGRDVNKLLLDQKFDYIFFTGSPQLGRTVMKAAAENLTPVTLELGGKSPCIVDADANIEVAARRIVWGKFLNAGQTCIAPDYMFAHKSIKAKLLECMKAEIVKQFSENPKNSPDFPRIVNQKAFERLKLLMQHGDIVCGGQTDREEKYIAPTIIDNVMPDYPIMQEEIFGPLLPVMDFENIEDVIGFVRDREKPLAFYYFSENKKKAEYLLKRTTSGGGCINDVIVHIANKNIPFGGVGNSGIGKYHGRLSFDTFSNKRSIVSSTTKIDIPVKYAPYGNKIRLLKMLLK
jgi:aldehyde dehydrogenase (NAD+)